MPEDIAVLPDLDGFGIVYSLHQAMVRDTSGQLKSLVEQFISATDVASRNALMDQILFKWTGSDTVDPGSSGPNVDARKLSVIEHLFGEPLPGKIIDAHVAEYINEAYRGIFEMMYADLMSQSHLKNLYAKITYTWDEEKQQSNTDFTGVIPDLLASLNNNAEAGKQLRFFFTVPIGGISNSDADAFLKGERTRTAMMADYL